MFKVWAEIVHDPKVFADMTLSLVDSDIRRAKDAVMATEMDKCFRNFVILELDRMEQEIEEGRPMSHEEFSVLSDMEMI